LFDSRDIYQEALRLLLLCPSEKPVREMAVSCFNLIKSKTSQLELFEDVEKKRKLVAGIDRLNDRWGAFVVAPARMAKTDNLVIDRIAFGGIKELEEFTLK
jgi:hypothetical protein